MSLSELIEDRSTRPLRPGAEVGLLINKGRKLVKNLITYFSRPLQGEILIVITLKFTPKQYVSAIAKTKLRISTV